MGKELSKTYNPAEVEDAWYATWEQSGAFKPADDDNESFTLMIPPPNVTGRLHMGHALNNTLQDILCRAILEVVFVLSKIFVPFFRGFFKTDI